MPGAPFVLPKVTVVTPVYNSADVIETCLQSVAAQTYVNKEHLILDAVSKDDTIKIVEGYKAKYPHIRLVSERDKGIYDAMNKGIRLAEGEWLFFMGSDDALAGPQVLSSIFEKYNSADYDIFYGNIQHRNTGRKFDNEFDVKLLARFNLAHQCIFYRKTVFDITGNFNLSYTSCADYCVNLKWFGNEQIRRQYVKEILCIYNEDGLSSIIYDKYFYRDKLDLLLKYLKFEKPSDFTDAARNAIYLQLKNRDIQGAFANLFKLLRYNDPAFNKTLFLKEFIVLLFKRPESKKAS